jgi:hypothetical protein
MPTNFFDALTPIARKQPRLARSIEVLRVAAQLDGDDFVSSTEKARNAALKWASKRAGAPLPPEAWQYSDFDLMAGGRNSAAVRISDGQIDLWALHTDDPDKDIAGRVWSTEIVIGGQVGQRPHLSVRLQASTTERDLIIEPSVPGTVLQILTSPGLLRDARKVMAVPRLIQSNNDAEDLCDYLEDEARRLPVFVIVLSSNGEKVTLFDDAKVAKATAGLARVVQIPESLTWVLTARFGRHRSVFNSGVRAYMPSFSKGADPYQHRLFLGENLRIKSMAESAASWLQNVAAETSISATRLGKEVLDFASVRTSSIRIRARKQTVEPDQSVVSQLSQQKLVDSL